MPATIGYYVTAVVCIITAFVIHRIYFKEKRRNATKVSLHGIKWFGLAIFSWGIGALLNIILVEGIQLSANDKIIIYFGVIFSLLNSLFIVMSLPSIEHGGQRNLIIKIVERFTDREVFFIFGGILFMIAFVFLVSFYNNNETSVNNSVIWLIDIPISVLVAFALLTELNKAFRNRGMRFMYLPTVALFLLILIAVTHRLIPDTLGAKYMSVVSWEALGVITALSFKFLFILLVSILLYSWKLLAEKEEKQSELEILEQANNQLIKERESLILANESHLDTIKHLKAEVQKKRKKYKELKKSAKVELSDRQKEVLGNLGVCGEHQSYTEIAEAMHIGVDGLQAHIYQIKKVLNIKGAGGKKQLIAYARENDLIRYATIK